MNRAQLHDYAKQIMEACAVIRKSPLPLSTARPRQLGFGLGYPDRSHTIMPSRFSENGPQNAEYGNAFRVRAADY